MSGTCIVTPGYLPPDGQPIDEAKLRLMASPTVQLGEKSVTSRELDEAALQKAVGNAIRPNICVNGNFLEERWLTSSVSAPAGEDTEAAEGWVANPTGAAITFGQTAEVPNAASALSAELAGALGAKAVDFAQNIPRSKARLLTSRLFFSAYIFNNTGADFAPKMVISTPDAANNFTAVTEQYSVDLETCRNQAWKQMTLAFDPGDYPNLENGLRMALRFPDGTLTAGGKTIRIAAVKLEFGDAPTGQPWDDGPDLALLNAAIAPVLKRLVPVGAIYDWLADTVPNGWLLAYGQAISRTGYSALFAVLGTLYGEGDGETTFNLPDLRGRILVGRDNMGGTAAARVTAAISGIDATKTGATGGDQRQQAHTHGYKQARAVNGNYHQGSGDNGTNSYTNSIANDVDAATASTGDGGSQNMPPVLVANRIIFTGVFA